MLHCFATPCSQFLTMIALFKTWLSKSWNPLWYQMSNLDPYQIYVFHGLVFQIPKSNTFLFRSLDNDWTNSFLKQTCVKPFFMLQGKCYFNTSPGDTASVSKFQHGTHTHIPSHSEDLSGKHLGLSGKYLLCLESLRFPDIQDHN